MLTILLVTIYISFISLGLPDSLLGSAWPAMSPSLNVSVPMAGIISMTISSGTIISSFFSDRAIKKFGTGNITTISVALTAAALLGNSFAPSFIWLVLFAIPLGLGAGAVDSALNNFVAVHYKAKHMNWLHCFWGIGATVGPIIMSVFLNQQSGWRSGYFTISIIQFVLVGLLLFCLPLWKKVETLPENHEEAMKNVGLRPLLKNKLAKFTLLSFFCYCGIESTAGLWGSTFLVNYRGVPVEQAAAWVSLYFLGITIGRLISGFVTMKISNKGLIRIGCILMLTGVIIFMLPIDSIFSMIALILMGIGCAPIFPCILHETPNRFGKELSQSAMGIQMSCAYTGATFLPPIFGYFASTIDFFIVPCAMLVLSLVLFVCCEIINKKMALREI